MHQGMGDMMGTDQRSQQYLQPWYDMSQQYLHLTHADDRMNYRSTHVVDANTVVPDSPPETHGVQRTRRRGGRRGGRRQAQAQPDEAGAQNQDERAPSYHGEQEAGGQFEAGTSDQAAPRYSFSIDCDQVIQNMGEASGSGNQFQQQNIFEYEPQYQYMTPPPSLPFQSQGSSNYGDLFSNCYQPMPGFGENVNRRINLPVPFSNFEGDIDINVPWNPGFEAQEEEEEEGRPRRNRRAPACGTGGRLGHGHNH